MAKSVQERCDKIIGQEGDFFMGLGAYKVGEGDAQETHYHYGAFFTFPTSAEANEKLAKIGYKRVVSVEFAPLPGLVKDGKVTDEQVQAMVEAFNGNAVLAELEKVRERKAPATTDTAVSVALGKVATVLRKKNEAGTIGQAKTPVPNAATPPLDKAGKINYRAWAKELQAAGHPWYGTAYKEATAEKGYE